MGKAIMRIKVITGYCIQWLTLTQFTWKVTAKMVCVCC